ncbi:MAG TPA: substrate-binding domain-containing protein [Xanthobacteraceae bacterium]|nr:substrate-binding domain-containing protein [Xanthobacteraceae bacterium]
MPEVPPRQRAIKVVSANAMREVIADLRAAFEAQSGHRLDVTIVETGEIRRRALAGEPFDVIIVPRKTADELESKGKMAPGAVPLIRVDLGLAVRAGGEIPDTRTAEALKRTFLAAKAVLITDPATGGISGVHLMEVLERLGIAETMKPRLVPNRGHGSHAERVVSGEADLAVQAEHEIRAVTGAVFLPYPEEFRRSIVFVAGVGAESAEAAAAIDFIEFLKGPATAAAIETRFLRPA